MFNAKLLRATALLACAASGLLHADAAGHRQAVERLFQLTDLRQMIEESVDTVADLQLRQNPQLQPHAEALHSFLEKYIGWDALKEDLVAMYQRAFTEPELKEMNAFYGSPTGKKVLAKLPQLVQERNRLAMRRLQQHVGELQEQIAASAAKSGTAPPAAK